MDRNRKDHRSLICDIICDMKDTFTDHRGCQELDTPTICQFHTGRIDPQESVGMDMSGFSYCHYLRRVNIDAKNLHGFFIKSIFIELMSLNYVE